MKRNVLSFISLTITVIGFLQPLAGLASLVLATAMLLQRDTLANRVELTLALLGVLTGWRIFCALSLIHTVYGIVTELKTNH